MTYVVEQATTRIFGTLFSVLTDSSLDRKDFLQIETTNKLTM